MSRPSRLTKATRICRCDAAPRTTIVHRTWSQRRCTLTESGFASILTATMSGRTAALPQVPFRRHHLLCRATPSKACSGCCWPVSSLSATQRCPRLEPMRKSPAGATFSFIQCGGVRLQLLHRRRIEIEDSRRVEAEDVSLGRLREEGQVGDLLWQIEIEMRPVRCVQQLGLGLDHVERTLERLEVVRL